MPFFQSKSAAFEAVQFDESLLIEGAEGVQWFDALGSQIGFRDGRLIANLSGTVTDAGPIKTGDWFMRLPGSGLMHLTDKEVQTAFIQANEK